LLDINQSDVWQITGATETTLTDVLGRLAQVHHQPASDSWHSNPFIKPMRRRIVSQQRTPHFLLKPGF
jgi:hypothetical protein